MVSSISYASNMVRLLVGTLLIYPLKKISTSGTPSSENRAKSKQSVSSSSSCGTSVPGSSGDASVTLRSILEDVCCRLSPIWSGLVYEGSVISKHAWGPLCLISRMAVILSELLPSLDSAVSAESTKVVVDTIIYDKFLVSMFSGFPYVLFESTVAMPGSKEEMEAKHLAGILNIAIGEATLLWCKESQVSKLLQANTSNENFKSSMKLSKDSKKTFAHTIWETEHLHSTMEYVHISLTFLNDSLSNKALSPTALMTDDWDDYLQRLFHCISLEVLFLSEKSSSLCHSQQTVSSADEEAVGHVLNDLCMLIRFSVEKLSSLSFSHSNSYLINRLTFILKSTATCASHITASETLLWETTNCFTISKITLLTQTLALLPKRMVDICRKSSAVPSSVQIDPGNSLSESEYVVYVSLSTLLLLLRRCSVRSEEFYADSDDHAEIEGDNHTGMHITSSTPSEVMWNTIVDEVSVQIAALFAESDADDDEVEQEDSVFANYSFPTRMLLLDIWYYCRFDKFEEVAEDSIVSVTKSSRTTITSIEQEKMLYLLYSRRSEMGVTAFVSSLMRGFETCMLAIYENYVDGYDSRVEGNMDIENSISDINGFSQEEEADPNEESPLLVVAELVTSSDWCVHRIATTLYQCGSSSSPHLIAKFTLRALQDMLADGQQHDETDLYCYSVGIFTILQTLLAPFRRENEFPCKVLSSAQEVNLNSSPLADNVDTVEGILYSATELMADFIIKLLLCRVGTADATSKMLKLGFRLLREGEPLRNSLLFPVFNGLVTRWEYEYPPFVGEEGEELLREHVSKVYSFDVFLLVLKKIGGKLSEFGTEEMISILDILFEIVQYWKLSEDVCFEIYETSLLEKLSQWREEDSVAENRRVQGCVGDIISFIKN